MFLYISVAVSVVFLCLIYYFQITNTEKKKSVEGLSLSMSILKNVVTILTLFSLYLSDSQPISFLAQGMSLVFGSYTVWQFKKYSKGDA